LEVTVPHITLEYTANIDRPQAGYSNLFAALHRVLADTVGVDVANCKSRAIRLDTYRVGDGGAEDGFVHLEVRIFDGRPVKLRREVGQRCLAVLEDHFSQARQELNLQITVSVKEIEQKTYLKAGSA
jgi:5-carboxymethyl-2-hydroxymuconate isomerase